MAIYSLSLCCSIIFCFVVYTMCSLFRKCMELRMFNERRRDPLPDPPLSLPVRCNQPLGDGGDSSSADSAICKVDGGDSSSECVICLDALREDVCRVLPGCNHRFHAACIGQWLSRSHSCPVCRLEIPPQPQIHIIVIP
uniref:RING-type domain-containing protein n=1 Tax=Nelumbo nucifera TaxID=4432 RepID=A0A822XZQ0_NELNU|nr:TPA_asm: hypothetical protein HUJ06_025983 [Nelumbo nucifera]